MRTLSVGLEAAQQSASYSPYVRLAFASRNRVTTATYATDDATNVIRSVHAIEGQHASLGEITLPGGHVVPIAAIISLDNYDAAFTSVDYRGYRVDIGWGVDLSPAEYSEGEPVWVVLQSETSKPGKATVNFLCISAWTLLDLTVTGAAGTPPFESVGRTPRNVLLDVLTDNPSTVFYFDSSTATYIVETTDAASDTASDVILADVGADSVNDILYIGSPAVFDRVTSTTTQIAIGSLAKVVEYWNGLDWTAVSDLDDQTNNYTNANPRVISFTKPTDWAVTTVNGVGSTFWLRIRITASNTTQAALGARIGIGNDWGLNISDSDSEENTVTFTYATPFDSTIQQIIRDALELTHSRLIMKKLYFDMAEYEDTPVLADYSYDLDGDHSFYTTGRERAPVLPNRITVLDEVPDSDTIQGSANDTDSQDQFGIKIEFVVVPGVVDNTAAATIASNILDRYKQERFQGNIRAPNNVGQEPWDWVSITDDRTGAIFNGRVGIITRTFIANENTFVISFNLGVQSLFTFTPERDPTFQGLRPAGTPSKPRRVEQLTRALGTVTGDVQLKNSSGTLTAAFARDGSGTLGVAGGDQITWDTAGILQGSFGGGNVILDADGIKLISDLGAVAVLNFRDELGDPTNESSMFQNGALTQITLQPTAGARLHLRVELGGGTTLGLVPYDAVDNISEIASSTALKYTATTHRFANPVHLNTLVALSGNIEIQDHLLPDTDNGRDFGSSLLSFGEGHISNVYTNIIRPQSGTTVSITGLSNLAVASLSTWGGDVVPDVDSTRDLGTTSVRWAKIWGDALTIGGTATFGTVGSLIPVNATRSLGSVGSTWLTAFVSEIHAPLVEADSGDLSLVVANLATDHVKFGLHEVLGTETIDGFIRIVDQGGTERKIAVVS